MLNPITINDGREIAQFEFRRRHGRLPGLALVQLPISQQRVDSIVFLVDLPRKCHAYRSRQSDSPRTSGEFYSWYTMVRLSLQSAVQLSQCLQLAYRIVARLGQRSEPNRSSVTCGLDKPAALRRLR